MPDDAASRYSPFINALSGGIGIGNRFSSGFYLGPELGAFYGRFRGSLRALFPFGVVQDSGERLSNPEFVSIDSDKPALLWGAGAGYALYSGTGFLLTLTAQYMRSDVADFGHVIGVALPLEWISRQGLRIGFETGLLRAFGGEVLGECSSRVSGSQAALECDLGEIRAFDREPSGGAWVHLIVGIPFDEPEPVFVP